MEVAAEPGFRADEPGQVRVHLVGLDRGKPHPVPSAQIEERHDETGQSVLLPEVAAVASEVRAGEHDLAEAGLEEPAGAFERFRAGKAAAAAAHVRNDAVRAERIASVLDLEERAGASDVKGRRGREFPERAPRTDPDHGLRPTGRAHQHLRIIALRGAQHRGHPRERLELLRGALRVAAGHDDPRARRLTVNPAYELPRLLIGATG